MNISFLECVACKQFTIDVVVLECCFSILCIKCRDKILKLPDGNKASTCIKCLKKFDIPLKTPDPFVRDYLHFLGASTKKSMCVSNFCERCELESEEMLYCVDCRKNLCVSCNINIHNVGRFKLHKRLNGSNKHKLMNFKLEDIKETEIYCPEHCNETINSVCLKENRLLCTICQSGHNQVCKTPSIVNLK